MEELVLNNMGLVKHVIQKKFANIVDKRYLLSFEDMVSDGVIGLCRASKTFDKEKGYEFSTYACICIEHAIRNRVNKELYGVNNYYYKDEKYIKIGSLNETRTLLHGEETEFIHELKDHGAENDIELKVELSDFISKLSPIQKKVILYKKEDKTCEQIAKYLNLGVRKTEYIYRTIKKAYKDYLDGKVIKPYKEREERGGTKNKVRYV